MKYILLDILYSYCKDYVNYVLNVNLYYSLLIYIYFSYFLVI